MKPILAHVKLSDIALGESNKMFRDDDELTDDALKELINSVRQVGVIQPVLLRNATNGKADGHKYELVAGERRYRASLACDLPTIPAKIQELTDEEAFDIQVTENLQRKDISPLKEANAYRYLVEKDPLHNTPAELALKFGKTEHYIHTRLKLTDLVDLAKEDLRAGHMGIGHALLLARLQPIDQERAIERCRYTTNKEKVVHYETVNLMKNFIESSVMCNLSKATFKKDDATLVSIAGPCTTCPKRSGANQLFSDIATQNDRCFDPACFALKRTRHLVANLAKMIEKSPDLLCLRSTREEIEPDVAAILKESNVAPINDFYTWDCGGVKAQGIWINGDEIGKKQAIWLRKSAAAKGSTVSAKKESKKQAIARIDERVQRSEQLDKEKVYARILEALKNHPTQTADPRSIAYYNQAEEAYMMFLLYDRLGYDDKEEFELMVGLRSKDDKWSDDPEPEALYNAFLNPATEDRLYLIRKLIPLQVLTNNNAGTAMAYFIRKIAEGYIDIPVDDFENDQAVIADKRRANAEKRKAKLEAPKPKKAKNKTKTKASD